MWRSKPNMERRGIAFSSILVQLLLGQGFPLPPPVIFFGGLEVLQSNKVPEGRGELFWGFRDILITKRYTPVKEQGKQT